MEGTGTKLRIYLDLNFLKIFYDNKPIPDDSAMEMTAHDTFRVIFRLIRNAEIANIEDGAIYHKVEFENVFAKIINKVISPPDDTSKQKSVFLENLNQFSVFPHSIFFVALPEEKIKEFTEKTGFAFAGIDNVYELIEKLSFSGKYSSVIPIIPDKQESSFNHTELKRFCFPTNLIYYIEPYLTTWSKEKIRDNLFGEIRNLFISSNLTQIKIKILSVYEMEYAKRNLTRKGKEKDVACADISELHELLTKEFNAYNLEIEIVYFKKGDLSKDNFKSDYKTELNDFYKQIDSYFHDRETYSNYLHSSSGRSRDFNMDNKTSSGKHKKKKRTKLFFHSHLNPEFLNSTFDEIKEIEKILNESKKPMFCKYILNVN